MKLSLCADWMTTNVSSTNLLHRLGGCGAVLRACTSNDSIYKFAARAYG